MASFHKPIALHYHTKSYYSVYAHPNDHVLTLKTLSFVNGPLTMKSKGNVIHQMAIGKRMKMVKSLADFKELYFSLYFKVQTVKHRASFMLLNHPPFLQRESML